jgi:hypothetical protein
VPGGGTELRSPCGVCIPGTPTREVLKVVHECGGVAALCNSGQLHAVTIRLAHGLGGTVVASDLKLSSHYKHPDVTGSEQASRSGYDLELPVRGATSADAGDWWRRARAAAA